MTHSSNTNVLRRTPLALVLAFTVLVLGSCSSLTNISSSLMNVQPMQFKIRGISAMRIGSIDIASKSSITSFSIQEALTLKNLVASKSMPVTFVLTVDAMNPNSGTNGIKSVPLTLEDLQWRLLIDGRPTITGGLERPLEIAGNNGTTSIPLTVSMDLMQTFSDRDMQSLVNLACALGGVNGSAANVTLDALPIVRSPLGRLSSDKRITIVDKEYRSK
jgi:hypothetical protein